MKILVLGGTRFFGVHLVNTLLLQGHEVAVATRGNAKPRFIAPVEEIRVDRIREESMRAAFSGREFDVVYDDLAYCSNDVKNALDTVRCRRYIMVSSISVYELKENTRETDYDPYRETLIWGKRSAFDYGMGKRQAEAALVQAFPEQESVMVRFPVVLGRDDYTERLRFYAAHTAKGIAMQVENENCPVSFISAEECGRFLAFLADSSLEGPVNAAASGTITIGEIIRYTEEKTGKKAVLSTEGEEAPYNGFPGFSINTEKAEGAGYHFSGLDTWIYRLLDFYGEMEG